MKLFTKAISETIDDEKLFVASDEVEDRQGEVIMQDGWNLSAFKKNPVIQWAHDPYESAIGIAEKIGFKTINGKKKLVYQPKYHRKTPMSNYIADLVEAGVIKASSVGFKPIEQDDNKYTKVELLEISNVNVGANQNALSLGLSKGYSPETIKAVMPDIKIEEKSPACRQDGETQDKCVSRKIPELKDEGMEQEQAVAAAINICKKPCKAYESENKSVIGYTKYPLSSADSWDAGAETKEADNADLKKMCAWYDSEKPDIKSSYKLPHHELSGYKTNWRGVAAAMAALLGARGGVQIPEADRSGVYGHLKRHYADFDKEAPELKMADEIVDKYVENKGADEKIIELTKTVNAWLEEQRAENETKKEIAEKNTEAFKKEITKRFEDIEFNVQGLTEGIKPSDKGLEQRLLEIESHIEKIAIDIRTYLSSSQGKGDTGREPKMTSTSKDPESENAGRLALKVLNRSVEILNKTYKGK